MRTACRTRADLALHLSRVFGSADFQIDTAFAAFVSAARALWFLAIEPRWCCAAWLPSLDDESRASDEIMCAVSFGGGGALHSRLRPPYR